MNSPQYLNMDQNRVYAMQCTLSRTQGFLIVPFARQMHMFTCNYHAHCFSWSKTDTWICRHSGAMLGPAPRRASNARTHSRCTAFQPIEALLTGATTTAAPARQKSGGRTKHLQGESMTVTQLSIAIGSLTVLHIQVATHALH